jgi:hypothetical protein
VCVCVRRTFALDMVSLRRDDKIAGCVPRKRDLI